MTTGEYGRILWQYNGPGKPERELPPDALGTSN